MKIVGVGCGPGLLTRQAIEAISQATLIFGSDRAIELARAYIAPACVVKAIDDYKKLRELEEDAVILSTGDPMLAGLGYLEGEVIPGISSLQVAAARLRVPLARIAIVVAHGTGHDMAIVETVDELKRKKIVFLLTDPRFDINRLYDRIAHEVQGTVKIAICENLGYPDERIVTGMLSERPEHRSDMYAMVIGNF